MTKENSCEIRFNPIDTNPHFSFPGAEVNQDYNPQVNLNFLKLMSIKEIPIFITSYDEKLQILQGEARISQYLQESCRITKQNDFSGSSSITSASNFILKDANAGQDGCSVVGDCTESQLLEQSPAMNSQ